MAKVEYFNHLFVLLNSVVNENRAVLQFSNSGSLTDCSAHAGKSAQQIDMVDESTAKTISSLAIVFGNMADDFSEVI